MQIEIFITGFISSLIQIMAIGAQDSLVIKNGIAGRYVILTPAVCVLCDILLFTISIFFVATEIAKYQTMELVFQYLGFVFLISYGAFSIISSFKGNKSFSDVAEVNDRIGKLKCIGLCIMLSLANPHAWVDIIVILGSISTKYNSLHERVIFYFGAIMASLIWFFFLSFLANSMKSVLNTPKFRKILDFIVGLMMIAIGVKLVL